jgi:hypothetical protein
MRIGKLEIIYHGHELIEPYVGDFKRECGVWYYLPIRWSVIHYLRLGKKLWAVKLRKFRSGDGLKESKAWVDTLQVKKNITIK